MNRFRNLIALICALCLVLSSGLAMAEAAAGDPPALPDGAAPAGQTPPDGQTMPNGTPPDGTPPNGDAPNGDAPNGDAPGGTPPNGAGGFGGSGTVTQGTAANTIDTDAEITGETYESTGDNENALRVTGAITATLTNITVSKTAGATDNTEDSDFYGQNAGLLVTDGATAVLTGANVTTAISGGNGVFAYGTGSVTISGGSVNTSMNNSGGIHVAGGGTLTAANLTVETQGNSAAAIRSDRGGGTLTVEGGLYTTNGTGSPAIYSTATISATDAMLTANHSEAIVVEGQNSVTLTDCVASGSMDGTYAEDGENIHNVMIYQSMSGDADVGQSHFSMTGGQLIANSGDMIYITNTSCTLFLSGVEMTYANDNLLQVVGNTSSRGWGAAGANGGHCDFTANDQRMEGVITVDSISTLNLTMQNGTEFVGTINPNGQAGEVNVVMDDQSIWTLTSNAYVTTFTGNIEQVETNGYTLSIANE